MTAALRRLSGFARSLTALRWLSGRTRATVLLADLNGDLLHDCLPAGTAALEVPMRGEAWYINANTLVLMVWYLWRYKRSARVGIRGCYLGAIARAVGARVIVTFIDNNNWEMGVPETFGVRVVNIQNGLRALPEWKHKQFDVLLTMHDLSEEWRRRYAVQAREMQTVGSLRLGLYLQEGGGGKATGPGKGDLLYVSQYRPGMEEAGRDTLFGAVDECQQILCGLLAHYVGERGGAIRIARSGAGRRDWASREEDYFVELFGRSVQFGAPKSVDPWSSYRELADARIVIGICSTLLVESLAMKKRTLLCYHLCGGVVVETWDYGVESGYLSSLFLRSLTFPALAEALDRLTAMDDREYWQSIRDEVGYFCAPAADRLPQTLIGEKIDMLLKEADGRDGAQA